MGRFPREIGTYTQTTPSQARRPRRMVYRGGGPGVARAGDRRAEDARTLRRRGAPADAVLVQAMDIADRQTAARPPRTLEQLGAPGGSAAPGAEAALQQALSGAEPRQGLWRRDLQWVVAVLVTLLLMWLTYSRGGWTPFLSGADLGVHEFGHLLTAWAPPLLCSLAGSFLQVAAPLGLGAYFWWRRDAFAVILCAAWAAENLNNVSVYLGDAQRMVLPLFGDDGSGAGHDWHNILGQLGWLGATDALANALRAASVCLFVVALGLAVLGFSRSRAR